MTEHTEKLLTNSAIALLGALSAALAVTEALAAWARHQAKP